MNKLPTLQEAEEYLMLRSLATNRVGSPWTNPHGVTVWPFALTPRQHWLAYRCERQLFDGKE
jgi:hypothetical protein